jgi:predicted transcriptional regulator
MFGFFRKKVERWEIDQIKAGVQTGFNSVKQDMNSLGKWVKHLDSNDAKLKVHISELEGELASVKEELENVKNVLSLVGEKPVFKQRQTVFNKQTPVYDVLNTVQTGVQTAYLDHLSSTERSIVFVLLNSDMKLSYEDLSAMLGKSKATIRGQVNSIKQKSEGLIEESVGANNKKRIFIPEKVKEQLLKKGKVRSVLKNLKKGESEGSEEGEY